MNINMNKKIYKLIMFILTLICIIMCNLFFNNGILSLNKIKKEELLKLQR